MAEQRGRYKRTLREDKLRIVRHADQGLHWRQLAEMLGVNYHTAYTWVRNADAEPARPRGGSHKKLNEDQIDALCQAVEAEPDLTLQQLARRSRELFGIQISASSMHNYLRGRLITLKKAHHVVATMNTPENKRRRREHVQTLSAYMRQGKYIVWFDETNVNLYCRRTQARAPAGDRAPLARPASKGPNVHIIGAISAYQVINITRRRGSFNADSCKDWVLDLIDHHLPNGVTHDSLVIICDNAPCHARLGECVQERPGIVLLKLGPYSPMLNPLENLWSKVKSVVKRRMRVPEVAPPRVGEQRLRFVEDLIDNAVATLTVEDCVRSAQHTNGFFPAVLAEEDMQPGV